MDSLKKQIEQMPKIELHKHLEGSIRLSTLREITHQLNKDKPLNREQFVITQQSTVYSEWLDIFWAHQSVLHSIEVLERVTFEVIEDSVQDNIRILELRYSPDFISINHPWFTYHDIHQAVLKGISRATQLYTNIAVGLIGIIDRNLPFHQAEIQMNFFIANKDTFVGVDLANDETKYPPDPFIPLFQKAKDHGLKVTIHSGESPVPTSVENVRTSISKLGATRIGHGVLIYTNEEIMKYVKESKVVLELCPTINWLVGLFPTFKDHPIKRLKDYGIMVTVSTDDPGLIGITLNEEYYKLVENGILTLEELEECNRVAYNSSFLPEEVKSKFWK